MVQEKTTKKPAAKKAGGGLAQPVTPSKALAAIVGAEPQPRSEVTKKVWDHIKKHDLQDAKNRREINADAALKAVIGKDKVTMFELTALVSKHLS